MRRMLKTEQISDIFKPDTESLAWVWVLGIRNVEKYQYSFIGA